MEDEILDKKDFSMIRYIHRRIKNNKNFLATITGPTGSGKSWTALSIAELTDPDFTVDNIIFKAKDLMKLINSGTLKAGSVIIWDEAGIDLSNRNWQSLTNKLLNALFQTFRHRQFVLLFTVPYHDFVDSATRKLFHADFETQRINTAEQEVIIKPKLLQYNPNMQKWYRKYLKVWTPRGTIKIKRWSVPKPSDKLIKDYEQRKNQFTSDLNKEIGEQLEKLEGKEKAKPTREGIVLTCECGHTWTYQGSGRLAKCPTLCGKYVKISSIESQKVVVEAAPELNLQGATQ